MERVLDIKSELFLKRVELRSLVKEAQSYLMAHHQEHFRSLKNETEREAFMRIALPFLMQCVERIEAIEEICVDVAANLKQTHFNLARTQDGALELWRSKIQLQDVMKRSQSRG